MNKAKELENKFNEKFQVEKIKKIISNKKAMNKFGMVFLMLAITFIMVGSVLSKYGIEIGYQILTTTGQVFLVCFIGIFALKIFFVEDEKDETTDKK